MAARARAGAALARAALAGPPGAARPGAPRFFAARPEEAARQLAQRVLREAQRNTALVAGVGVALLAAGMHAARGSPTTKEEGGGPLLTAMTWNLLARPFTKYNREHHRAPQALEDEAQTRQRYTLAGEQIATAACDLVLLQECEEAFFQEGWNSAAPKLLQMYTVLPCRREGAPGTAVLVKRGGRAQAASERPLCVGGSEATGGPSKVATVAAVRAGGRAVSVVSTHFAWDGAAEARLRHAELIAAKLPGGGGGAPRGGGVLVGGDLNCQPGAALEALQGASFLGGLRRVELPPDTVTSLSGDFRERECIDHFYVSSDLRVRSAVALGQPRSPWGGKATRPAKVAGASDHVPVWLELEGGQQ